MMRLLLPLLASVNDGGWIVVERVRDTSDFLKADGPASWDAALRTSGTACQALDRKRRAAVCIMPHKMRLLRRVQGDFQTSVHLP